MINLMYIIDDLLVGGAQELLLTNLKAIDRKKFNIIVVALFAGGSISEEMRKEDIPVKILKMRKKYDFTILFKLIKLIKKEKIQIVHTHLIIANFYGRLAAKLAKIPVVISTLHNTFYNRPRYYMWSDRLMYPLTDKVITVSEAVKQWVIKEEGVNPGKFVTIYNAIDLSKFNLTVDKGRIREELALDKDISLIAMIGTLRKSAGLDFILKALPMVLKEIPELKLLIVGEGPIRKNSEELAKRLNINQNVIFCGRRRDIPEILSIIDLFVTTHLWEAFGIVIIEAMAMAKPVISLKRGGVPEIVKEGETGLLIAPGDIQALSEAIIKLLKDKGMSMRMGAAGYKLVREKFSSEIMVNKLEEIYGSLLESKYNDLKYYKLHYVTAREAYNIACAAQDGKSGSPNQYRDYIIPPYVNTKIKSNVLYQLKYYKKDSFALNLFNDGKIASLEFKDYFIHRLKGEIKSVEYQEILGIDKFTIKLFGNKRVTLEVHLPKAVKQIDLINASILRTEIRKDINIYLIATDLTINRLKEIIVERI